MIQARPPSVEPRKKIWGDVDLIGRVGLAVGPQVRIEAARGIAKPRPP
jgi:hypothetical protein